MEIKVLVDGREVLNTEVQKNWWSEYTQLRNDIGDLVGIPLGTERPSDEVLLQKLHRAIHRY
jgi:hypothetical protein